MDVTGLDGRVVLIAEDDPLLRRGISRLVSKRFTPVECGTFMEAMVALDTMECRPAAMIVDVNLGANQDGDGLDLAAHAQRRFGQHVPTLVLTGQTAIANLTERAHRMRAEFLGKPQDAEALTLFLERATVRESWDVPDVLELDQAVAAFVAAHHLTTGQAKLLFAMMRAADRGERLAINANTRKAGLRRILAKTGHASFEQVRAAIKQMARGGQGAGS